MTKSKAELSNEKFPEKLVLPATASRTTVQRNACWKRWAVLALGLTYLVYYSWSFFDGETGLGSALDSSKPRILNGKPAEKLFLQIPNPESINAAHRKYASHAHVAGSEQDLVTAKIVIERFREGFGLPPRSPDNLVYDAGSAESQTSIYHITPNDSPRAWIDTYFPLLDTPHYQSLEVVDDDGNTLRTINLLEICDPRDEDAYHICEVVPPVHAYSADGNVTGELVYANYGGVEDFEELERLNVDVAGKIVLVRNGGNMRGLKIQNSEERGAVGVLVYSDVRDDGGVTVENGFLPYPEGPARQASMIERGSVQYVPVYPGDPSTPGFPAYKNSTRVESANLPSIPSLPLSWENTEYLLSEQNKTGSVRLRLVNRVDREIKPIWNTMALIPGYLTDEVVVVGNHRDAWGLGAVDPSSGSACMDEVFRAFGDLYQKGWRPLRTILFASWDGEEFGLTGSTEWNEDFASWIGENVVAYVNLDVAVRGTRWTAGASPSLSHFVRQVAQDVPHPIRENATLWDTQYDLGPFIPPNVNVTQENFTSADGLEYIVALGSGSDFSPFLQRIGIVSTETSFNAASQGDAVYPYHSMYDSIPFIEKFVDPGYHRFTAMSRYLGLQALRLADGITLPVNTTHYAVELITYTDRVAATAKALDISVDLTPLYKTISKLYDATERLEKEKLSAKKALLKSLKRWRKRHSCLRSLWSRICRTLKKWKLGGCKDKDDDESEMFNESLASRLFDSDHHRLPHYVKKAIKRVRKVNSMLASFEAGFISEEGLPGRNWYRHFGVAPGKRLGYGATTLPALTESLTLEKNATLARVEVERLSKMIKKLAKHIEIV